MNVGLDANGENKLTFCYLSQSPQKREIGYYSFVSYVRVKNNRSPEKYDELYMFHINRSKYILMTCDSISLLILEHVNIVKNI